VIRCWPHVFVSDVRASSRWYQRLLGGRSVSEPEHPHRELFQNFDACWERVRGLGAEVVGAPATDPAGYRTRGFSLRDPDGYLVRVGDGANGWFASLLPGWGQAAR
jgi:hypothetical protein